MIPLLFARSFLEGRRSHETNQRAPHLRSVPDGRGAWAAGVRPTTIWGVHNQHNRFCPMPLFYFHSPKDSTAFLQRNTFWVRTTTDMDVRRTNVHASISPRSEPLYDGHPCPSTASDNARNQLVHPTQFAAKTGRRPVSRPYTSFRSGIQIQCRANGPLVCLAQPNGLGRQVKEDDPGPTARPFATTPPVPLL